MDPPSHARAHHSSIAQGTEAAAQTLLLRRARSSRSSGDGDGQEGDLKLTADEEVEVAEQDELLEQLSIRTDPLGQDRFYNQYWWFPVSGFAHNPQL